MVPDVLEEARAGGWHRPVLDRIVATAEARAAQVERELG
jgi:hypothetical protein